jgi:hypothetical protein
MIFKCLFNRAHSMSRFELFLSKLWKSVCRSDMYYLINYVESDEGR